MNPEKIANAISLLLLALVCFLVWQNFDSRRAVAELRRENAELKADISAFRKEFTQYKTQAEEVQGQLREQNAELRRQLTELRSDLAGLTGRPGARSGDDDAQSDDELAPLEAKDLKNGFYQLSARVTLLKFRKYGPGTPYTKEYSIHAVRTGIGTEDRQFAVVLGVAICLGTPQLFVDYDSDGQNDFELLNALAEMLPGFALVTKTMHPRNSQTTYEAFLARAGRARFLPLDAIPAQADTWADDLLRFVREQSDFILSGKWAGEEKGPDGDAQGQEPGQGPQPGAKKQQQ